MDRDTFENLICRAKSLKKQEKKPEYWTGYMHGLRRRFLGNDFGTSHEHHLWLTACQNETQKLRSQGYRDGYESAKDCPTSGT